MGREMVLSLGNKKYYIKGTDVYPKGGVLTLELGKGNHEYNITVPGTTLQLESMFYVPPGGKVAKAVVIAPPGARHALSIGGLDAFDIKPEDVPQN